MLPLLGGKLLLGGDPVPLLYVSAWHRAWPTVNIQKCYPRVWFPENKWPLHSRRWAQASVALWEGREASQTLWGSFWGLSCMWVGGSLPLALSSGCWQESRGWTCGHHRPQGILPALLLTPLTKKTPWLREGTQESAGPRSRRTRGPREQTNTAQRGPLSWTGDLTL